MGKGKVYLMKGIENLLLCDVFVQTEYHKLAPQDKRWALLLLIYMRMKHMANSSQKDVLIVSCSCCGLTNMMYHLPHNLLNLLSTCALLIPKNNRTLLL